MTRFPAAEMKRQPRLHLTPNQAAKLENLGIWLHAGSNTVGSAVLRYILDSVPRRGNTLMSIRRQAARELDLFEH